jgi:exonuclease SbcD
MRLLHIADVHLERSFKRLGPRYGRQRRAELRETLGRVLDLVREKKADALCIAGDLFERENALPAVGEFLRASFAELRDVPVLIAPGDRDYFSPGCLYDQVTWPSNVHIFRTAALRSVSVVDCTVWGCAFDGPEQRQSPLAEFATSGGGPHLGLFHAEVAEGDTDSVYAPLDPREISASGLRFALLGHEHTAFVDEQRRFAYPGSLEPLDPREGGPRGAILLDVTSGDVHVERISVAQRRVTSDEIDVSAISTIAELQQLIAARQSGWEHAEVNLRLLGRLQGELEDVDAVRSAFRSVDVDPEIVARPEEDFGGLSRQRTSLGAFVRVVQSRIDGAVDDDTRQYWSDVLRAGIGAFRARKVAVS